MSEQEFPENADGVFVAYIAHKDNETLFKIQTYDRVNDNKPLGVPDLFDLYKAIEDILKSRESEVKEYIKSKPKLIIPAGIIKAP